MRTAVIAAVLLSTTGPVIAKEPPAVVTAPAAAALLPDLTANGRAGRYEMTVAAVGGNGRVIFLNSTADYRAPGNLTFSIGPAAAKKLVERLGAPAESFFAGKTVTVDGVLRRERIMSIVAGRPHDTVRWQATVRIEQASQVVAVR